MGVLTDKHFSATAEKCSLSPAGPEQQRQLQLAKSYPTVVQSPFPCSAEELECLEELRILINETQDVRDSGVEQDDEFLLAFVRGKKCNAEKAFKTVSIRRDRLNFLILSQIIMI